MKNVFSDLYDLSKWLSKYLPFGQNLSLEDIEYVIPSEKRAEGEHWVTVGKTGTGKTTLNKSLIRAHRIKWPWLNTYILDSKKQGDFNERDGHIYNQLSPPPVIKTVGGKQVWQPVRDDINAYSDYFEGILQEGKPSIVYTDEAKNLKFFDRSPKGFELLLSQGRRPGIHTISSTQEVARSPRQMFSQPSHVVSFHVWNDYDERRMKQYLRINAPGNLPLQGKYSMLYIRPDVDSAPTLFKSYRELVNFWLNL